MSSNNLSFCFSCKRPTNELFNFATENDIDGIPFKTKLSSFVFKTLEERCEKYFCKVCVTQISTTYNFIQSLFDNNVIAKQYINHELKKNPSTKLPMRISYGNMSQFECEQREASNNSCGRQILSDAFSKGRKKMLNLTEYFKAKSPVVRRYSSGAESVYGSTVNLAQIPLLVPFEDPFTQGISAIRVSDLDSEDLSDKERKNNSICHRRDIKVENEDKDLEVVRYNDYSKKDLNKNKDMKEVRSTGRCRTHTSEGMEVVKANSLKRRAAYSLNTLFNNSDEENEQFFEDDKVADPSYKLGTFTGIPKDKRPKFKSPITTNTRSPSSSLKMQCPICEKSYNKSWYSNHLKTHSNVFDYQCDVCGHKFKVKAYLKKHMKNHEQLSLIKCVACPGVFQGVGILKEHLLAFHENVFRSGVCKLCGKNCKIAVNLNSHIAKHHL